MSLQTMFKNILTGIYINHPDSVLITTTVNERLEEGEVIKYEYTKENFRQIERLLIYIDVEKRRMFGEYVWRLAKRDHPQNKYCGTLFDYDVQIANYHITDMTIYYAINGRIEGERIHY